MNSTHYDVIVLGAGGMGSAATYELARRGKSVLALEQFPLIHDRGSSHGHTRIIRTAYYEHPAYVPLVQRAFERWYDLEQSSGSHLLTACPCLGIGRPESEVIAGVKRAASEHSLPVETLANADLRRRYPQFQFGDDYVGVLESQSGFLYVEECVRAHLEQARLLGASILAEEPAIDWQAGENSVRVKTTRGTYEAGSLVISAGPWAGQLLAGHGQSLRVMRQVLQWFGPETPDQFRRDRFPIFLADTPGGEFYGLPGIDRRGVKIARHYGAPELLTPAEMDRGVSSRDEAEVRTFLTRYLPGADGPLRDAQTCIYTLTPDRHFILDRHPVHANVAVAAGFSGHGFKFCPVVGEILADLVDLGRTSWETSMFGIRRPALLNA